MDVYFILWVTIKYCIIYFLAEIVLALAPGSSFNWLLCPFDRPPSLFLLLVKGKSYCEPSLVWLSGLGARLRTEGLPVLFPVRAHA